MSDNPHWIPETDESDNDESSGRNVESIPPEILERANEVINNLTPATSRLKYESAYKKFMQWRANKRITSLPEEVFLTYFSELSETLLPSTLWARYSMLRSMVDIKHNFNIHNYSRLMAFLKQNSKGFKSTKAQTLSAEQIDQFLREAPDKEFLATKVALIFGVQGACRRQELCDVLINHIEDKGDMLLVQVPDTKTRKPRSFVVTNEFYNIYKKYAKLRPINLATKKFFIGYRNGKCTSQNIGINSFGAMPQKVAKFLKLANPNTYTGHTFRRTSTTLLADSGADLLTIKRHGGWKSSSVAEGYIENSVGNKKRIGQRIAETITSRPSTSKDSEPLTGLRHELSREAPMDIGVQDKIDSNFEILNSVPSGNSKNLNITFSNCSNVKIYLSGSETD